MNEFEYVREDNDSLITHDDPVVCPGLLDGPEETFIHTIEYAENSILLKKKRKPRITPLITNRPLFPHMPLDINSDVLQFKDFERERNELVSSLEILSERTGRQPIWLIEHKECFTNVAMRKTLTKILGGVKFFQKYVLPITIDSSVYQYPTPEDDTIFILGGSTNNTYDSFGHDFTRRFSLPLLEEVVRSNRLRVLGICFGHQSLVEAYGTLVGTPIKTIQEDYQFGYYPVDFTGNHPALKYLVSEFPRCVAFTRSGYPRREGNLPVSEIPGLHVTAQFTGELLYTDKDKRNFIPQGVSYLPHRETLQDMVVSFQGHPEIKTLKTHLQPITEFIEAMREQLTHIIEPVFPLEIPKHNHYKMIADAFFTPLLKHFADELVRY